MKHAGGKIWFTAAELAELALPGLPNTKRKINEDWAPRWASQIGAEGEALARPRRARGGGIEFHLSVLPAAARVALAQMGVAVVADVSDVPETSISARWSWYEGLKNEARAKAEHRAGLIAKVETMVASGINASAAVPLVAANAGVGASTLWGWMGLVEGVRPGDRLPYLAPQNRGGGAEGEVPDDIWQLLVSDYLRPEKPTFTSCYRRVLKKYAAPRGIALPHERSLRRKLDRDIDPRVVILRREGAEALRQTLPPQERTVMDLHAMEVVNIDGHRWDVFVKWPDGTIARPVTIGIQDVYSRKILAWSTGKTESAVETRLAFAHLFARYGIPAECVLDNGRAFASKWITGGATSRFRFAIREEEPLGILTALGVKTHWTLPYRGSSKPIERAWRDFCDTIAKDPDFAGAYTGNKPDAKPENYGSKAVPLDRFLEVIEAGIAAHNAQPGRRTEMGRGLRSLDEVFAESYAVSPIGKATPEQLRLALLAADDVTADRKTGAVTLHGNRYWHEDLAFVAGDKVTVRFDPDDLHAAIHVYSREGAFLCTAPVIEAVGFRDVEASKRRGRQEADYKKAIKALAKAEQILDAADVAATYERAEAADIPAPGVPRLVPNRGQTARQLRTTSQTAPRTAQQAAQAQQMSHLAAGLGKLRSVK
ncbi:MAG: transposase domain-containing protein [Candidatus Sphingomonas phytovorans]|nr:transposase domain-containing protein [Sphingomonas sp.]WEK00625.1 MAG: transposase domain-containing protein [Sphingomonas sp.]